MFRGSRANLVMYRSIIVPKILEYMYVSVNKEKSMIYQFLRMDNKHIEIYKKCLYTIQKMNIPSGCIIKMAKGLKFTPHHVEGSSQ